MPEGVQLIDLVEQLRAEIGAAPTSSGQGINSLPMLQQILRRTQARLYLDFDWPNYVIDRDVTLQAGERFYTFPQDINFNFIKGVWINYSASWREIAYGFTPVTYNSSNPDLGTRSDPIQLWRHYEVGQYEVWPVPASSNQILRFRALMQLPRLTDNADKALLDDTLIVLFAAAEILTRKKDADAQAKLQMAQSHFRNMKSRISKGGITVMGGMQPFPRSEWTMITKPI